MLVTECQFSQRVFLEMNLFEKTNYWLRLIWFDLRGVVAVEFAIILPLGVIILLGTIETTTLFLIDRKLSRAVHTVGDLVSQETQISEVVANELIGFMQRVLDPYPSADLQVVLTSVLKQPDDAFVVDWSFSANTTALTEGSNFVLPDEFIVEVFENNSTVIVAKGIYNYTPLFGDFIFDSFTLEDTRYVKPRNTQRILDVS